MKKTFLVLAFSLIVLVLWMPVNALAIVIPVDMSDFSTHRSFVSQSGNKALLLGYGDLSIDPAADDADVGIMLPANVVSLSFNYLFFNGFHDSYSFGATVMDEAMGDVGNFTTGDSGLGTVTIDLAGKFSEPTSIGLKFAVASLGKSAWCDFSFLKIFDPVITVKDDDVSPVPEPTAMLMLGIGLLGVARAGRKGLIRRQ